MSDLLSIGRSGVTAYRGALAAVGENVTNSDTVGFARRSVTLTEQSAAGGNNAFYKNTTTFGGVQASQVTRVWDQFKAADAWSSGSDANRASTRAQYASSIETMLDDSDSGVGTRLTAVFTSATNLAANPSDQTLRQTMVAALGEATSAIGQTGSNLAKIADTVRTQAVTIVGATNDALTALARINVALHSAPQGTAGRAQLEDQRDSLITTISGNVGVDVTLDPYGAASLRFNDYMGPMLLKASDTNPQYLRLDTAADGRLSTVVVDNDGTTSPAIPTGGTLAGLVDASNTIASQRGRLDGIAKGFVTSINDWNQAGMLADGVTNGDKLLDGIDAATIKVLPTTTPDSIAAALGGADNGNLLALSSLRGSTGVEASWRSMVTDQALQVAAAKTEATTASTRKDSAYSALDNVSGVDLDTEAAELLRFQQAYSASAKVIQTARETLQSILELF